MEQITCVNGNVLRWARFNSGTITLKFIEENIKSIEKWEKGEAYPTYAELEKLSSIYKKPLAVFFFPKPPEMDGYQTEFRTMSATDSQNLSYKVVRLINEALVMQINLKELNGGNNPVSILLNKYLKEVKKEDLITEAREILNISIEKQFKIRSAKEMFEVWRDAFYNLGIYVFKESFHDESISGFCLYDDEFPVIYINNSMSFTRQIFTLFHELYHLIRETGGVDKIKDIKDISLTKEQQGIELMCNEFAGDFLIPINVLLDQIASKNISYELICYLAEKFNVSQEAMMVRLINLKRITWDFYNENMRGINLDFYRAKSKSSGGNHYNTLVNYLGNGYLSLAFKAHQANRIDTFQLAAYTKTKVNNISSLEMAWGWKK